MCCLVWHESAYEVLAAISSLWLVVGPCDVFMYWTCNCSGVGHAMSSAAMGVFEPCIQAAPLYMLTVGFVL